MKMRNLFTTLIILLIVSGFSPGMADAQNTCGSPIGCSDYSNYGVNAINFKTIEYDNITSGYHATAIITSTGKVQVWGEQSMPNGSGFFNVPTTVNSSSFPGIGNSVPFKIGLGSSGLDHQYILLTTDGRLWAWGVGGVVVGTALTSSTNFQTFTPGGSLSGTSLPVPANKVKMMFVTSGTIAITTCGEGDVWVLSLNGLINQTNSTTATNTNTWQRVRKSAGSNDYLTGVVATRGNYGALYALDKVGNLWTWGYKTYVGDGSGTATGVDKQYATQMAKPAGETGDIKMIGSIGGPPSNRGSYNLSSRNFGNSYNSYYVLYENGHLYALGRNNAKQLGNWNTTNSTSWVQPKYTNTTGNEMNNIKWISPQEHDVLFAFINVINDQYQLYNWGQESGYVLGRNVQGSSTNVSSVDPGKPTSLNANPGILAVESGGHTTVMVQSCTDQFGYIGHEKAGSMGNGSNNNSTGANTINNVQYNTNAIAICGVQTVASSIQPNISGPFCKSSNISIVGSPAGGVFSIVEGGDIATIDPVTGKITFTANNKVGVVRVRYVVSETGLECNVQNSEAVLTIGEGCEDQIHISGLVWEDNNRNAIQDAFDEVGNDNGHWANLVKDGFVIATAKVNADGTYSIPVGLNKVSASGDYHVMLTNNSMDEGDLLSNGHTPANMFEYTGVNRDNTNGDVANLTGAVNIGDLSVISGSPDPVNFGIRNRLLPISLSSFTATKGGNKAILNWSTVSEQNNHGFDVERSSDGKTWRSIGYLSSKATNGNSNNKISYSFMDENPDDGVNYYRLRQVDLNGNSTLSEVRKVEFTTESKISVYPNPLRTITIVKGLSGKESIKVFDTQGRLVLNEKALNGQKTLNFINLGQGTYRIQIMDENGKLMKTVSVIKMN